MAEQTAALHPTTLLLDASPPLRRQRSVLIRRFCSAAILPRYSPELRGVHPGDGGAQPPSRPWLGSKPTAYGGRQHPRHRVEQCCHRQFSSPYL